MNYRLATLPRPAQSDDKQSTIELVLPVVSTEEDSSTSPMNIDSLVGKPTTLSIPIVIGIPPADDTAESRSQR